MENIKHTFYNWLNHDKKTIRIRNYSLVLLSAILLFSSLSGAMIHHIDQAIAGAEMTEITLDQETRNNYKQQILDFIQYEDLSKLQWAHTKQKREETYVYIFDGYTYNIFVFKNGELTKHGTNNQYELIPVHKE